MKVWPEWREPLTILLPSAALCALFDALVFRTRFYTRVLDPQTSTGSFELTLSNEAARDYWARPVLVLGNSIIVQGFSQRLANWLQQAHGYQFSSVAVPANWDRCWYYLLRALDPSRTRYSVIVVPVESYDDRDLHHDPEHHRSVATLASRLCRKCSASSRETCPKRSEGRMLLAEKAGRQPLSPPSAGETRSATSAPNRS